MYKVICDDIVEFESSNIREFTDFCIAKHLVYHVFEMLLVFKNKGAFVLELATQQNKDNEISQS